MTGVNRRRRMLFQRPVMLKREKFIEKFSYFFVYTEVVTILAEMFACDHDSSYLQMSMHEWSLCNSRMLWKYLKNIL